MNIRSFLSGFFAGIVVVLVLLYVFGDQIRSHLAATTKQIGQKVEKAGENIKEQGEKIR